jgi:hypothetical protein
VSEPLPGELKEALLARRENELTLADSSFYEPANEIEERICVEIIEMSDWIIEENWSKARPGLGGARRKKHTKHENLLFGLAEIVYRSKNLLVPRDLNRNTTTGWF